MYRVQHIDGRRSGKGHGAGEHAIKNDAEGEYVGTRIGLRATRLLGRHVADRAHCGAMEDTERLGVGIGRCRCHHLRQAKIEDFDAVVASHQNVCGLEVAMDDACRVRRGDGVSDRTANRESAIDGKSTRRDQVVKRRAGDILHHNAGQAADEEDVVNGDDSRMIE